MLALESLIARVNAKGSSSPTALLTIFKMVGQDEEMMNRTDKLDLASRDYYCCRYEYLCQASISGARRAEDDVHGRQSTGPREECHVGVILGSIMLEKMGS